MREVVILDFVVGGTGHVLPPFQVVEEAAELHLFPSRTERYGVEAFGGGEVADGLVGARGRGGDFDVEGGFVAVAEGAGFGVEGGGEGVEGVVVAE